jgi:RND family efflux transporter MFP subunit
MSLATAATKSGGFWRSMILGAVLAGAVIVLLLWLAGFFHPKIGGHAPPLAETPLGGRAIVTATFLRVPAEETAVGTIQPVLEATIAPEVLGRIVALHVRAGQSVTQGQVLVELDDEDLKARLRQAEARVAAARATRDQAAIELERVRRLHAQEAASLTELQRTEAAALTAEAEFDAAVQFERSATKALSYTTIVAPFDGLVVDTVADVGDTVAPGQPLLAIQDPTRMQLVAAVRETLIGRLAEGQPVQVSIEALGHPCIGRVAEIVPRADAASRTFLVKVTGPCPPDVRPGMFGRLSIPLDEEEWIVVPTAAVRRVGQLELVDILTAGGGTLPRAVRLGRTRGEFSEVLAGLEPGEPVALPAGVAAPAADAGDGHP